MKCNSNESILLVDKLFAGRGEQRQFFWNTYEEFRANLDLSIDNDIKVIHFYGIGGIGKTSLLKKLEEEVHERIKQPYCIYINLENDSDKLSVLTKIRNHAQRKYGFVFPIFDLSRYVYLDKLGDNVKKEEIQSFISSSPILTTLLNISSAFPVVGNVSTIVKGVDDLIAAARNRFSYEGRKKELSDLQNEDSNSIYEKLQYFLARDLSYNLKGIKEPFVVMLDTYETLTNENSSKGMAESLDRWLRDLQLGFIINSPNVIWITAGREMLKWVDASNREWEEALCQNLVGDLAPEDADLFLEKAGIFDQLLRNQIYELTNGTPLYLDICVGTYHNITANKHEPTIKNLGSDRITLIERFVKYMDDQDQDLVYMLSCLDEWDEELLYELAMEILPSSASPTRINRIKGFSTIVKFSEDRFSMHKTVRQVLFESPGMPKYIKYKTTEFMKLYLSTQLNQISYLDVYYPVCLKRYLFYSLRDKFSSCDEFIEFYKNWVVEHLYKLEQVHKYNEICSIQEMLLKYAEENYKGTIAATRIQLSYAKSLFQAGKYEQMENFIFQSVGTLSELMGKNDPFVIEAHLYLAKCFDVLGKKKKARGIYKKVIQCSRMVHGSKSHITIGYIKDYALSDSLYLEQGIKLNQVALEDNITLFGETSLSTIELMDKLAFRYRRAKRFDDAIDMSGRLLQICRVTYGDYHLSTINALRSLSISLGMGGDKENALELAIKDNKNCVETYGLESLHTIEALNNLAIRYAEMGHMEESISTLEKAVEISTQVFGEDYPKTIDAINKLSMRYLAARRLAESVRLQEKILELRTIGLGRNHNLTRKVMKGLAETYKKIGLRDKYILLLEEIYEMNECDIECLTEVEVVDDDEFKWEFIED